ncbi:MAG: hypothetical protein WKH64_16960, partial [Chloroflexia bacterium]
MGELLRIRASVSAPSHLVGQNRLYLQDETGGILVTVPDSAQSYSLGDVIEATGSAGAYFGERRLRVDASGLRFVSEGPQPQTTNIATSDVGAETEGKLVRIEGVVTRSSKPAVWLDDVSGEAQARVADSTGITWPSPRKGDTLTVVGVVSSFNGGYRVLPRYDSDMMLTRRPTPTPQPTQTPLPTGTPQPTPTAGADPSPTPTGTPTPTVTPNPDPTVSPGPDPTATANPAPRTVTVSEARALPAGEVVRVVGVVTSPAHLVGARRLYIQDDTAGILVTVPNDSPSYTSGDVVRVDGRTGTYFGERALRSEAGGVAVLSDGEGLEPTAARTGDVGPETEGSLVRLRGEVVG